MSGKARKPRLQELDVALVRGDERSIWKAAEALGEYAEAHPEAIWPLVVKHGSSENAEVRAAIATCVLEHILEYHFDRYFPEVEALVRSGNRSFAETFRMCWKFGQSEEPGRAKRWDALCAYIAEHLR